MNSKIRKFNFPILTIFDVRKNVHLKMRKWQIERWNIPLSWDGTPCSCSRRICNESYASIVINFKLYYLSMKLILGRCIFVILMNVFRRKCKMHTSCLFRRMRRSKNKNTQKQVWQLVPLKGIHNLLSFQCLKCYLWLWHSWQSCGFR